MGREDYLNTIEVYYDGICKICSKEINHYKKIAPPATFQWIDIARNGDALKNYNIKQETALKHLHVKDRAGKFHIGVDAFQIMWQHLPNWRILAQVLKFPPVKFLAKILYNSFAERRFRNTTHCQFSIQSDK